MDRLTAWFSGAIALPRHEAHSLLQSMVESDLITQHRAEFVAAVKALAAGPSSWNAMGYRLLPDD
jgi:DNA-binding IclR family transcriptional regulator